MSTGKIIKKARLEGTSKDHLVQPFIGKGAQMRLSSTLPSCVLKTSSDEDSNTSLGSLFE